jgi:hypothetical protein
MDVGRGIAARGGGAMSTGPRSFQSLRRGTVPFVAVLLCTAVASAQSDLVLTVTDTGPAPPLTVSILLDNWFPAHGWAWGMCHDPAGLAVVAIGHGAVGSTVNGGSPPDFTQTEIFADGWTVGVIISLYGGNTLEPGTGQEIGEATYDGLADGDWTVCPCDTLGVPPVAVVIVGDGASLVPQQICGTVAVDTSLAHEFRRGDVNSDGSVDIADPIALFDSLFSAGLPLPCEGAADANGDGTAGVGDVIALLAYLFSGGAPPAPPFPACGTDPFADCDVPVCP